jgi:hypothetical protein
MHKFSLEDYLNLYDDRGEDGAAGELAGLSQEALVELESLARVNRLLKQTLAPVPARLAFREDLRQSLLTTAMQRQGWRGMVLVNLRSHWKLTAATASGVSVAVGAIGVAVWYRARS